MSVALSPSYTQRVYNWTDWKDVLSKKKFLYQHNEDSTFYQIWGYDGPEVHVCYIWKGIVPYSTVDSGYTQSQNDSDKTDWETNYKNESNRPIFSTVAHEWRDDGRIHKKTGWHRSPMTQPFEVTLTHYKLHEH